jgi:hypothetical protein
VLFHHISFHANYVGNFDAKIVNETLCYMKVMENMTLIRKGKIGYQKVSTLRDIGFQSYFKENEQK